MNATQYAEQLLVQGIEFKKMGDFEKAEQMYLKSIEYNSQDPSAFINLGKIFYLRSKYTLAAQSYLACMHLQINSRELKNIGLKEYPFYEKYMNDQYYDDLPYEIKNLLPLISGLVIFQDPNISRHIAHSVYDYNNKLLELNKYIPVYRAQISGDGTFKNMLLSQNLSETDFDYAEENIYMPRGIDLLINNIQWEKIMDTNVLKIYF
jgi:tetratricopeptide (TPR) repeat protein